RLPANAPDLSDVGHWLAAHGVTAVTDAGANNGPEEVAILAAAGLPQRVTAMTASPAWPGTDGVACGPVKILLDEADLPDLDDLSHRVTTAHVAGRSVAVHCVDAASLALALAAGIGPGDRIEHASVVPDQLLPVLVASGAT